MAVQGHAGSFASSGAQATTAYLGSWGFDPGANTVWAVLNHNSQFAAIPEPPGALLLIFGLATWVAFFRNRRKGNV